MKYLGYLFKPLLWIFGLALSFWLWFFKAFFSIFIPDSWKSDSPPAPSGGFDHASDGGGDLQFTIKNGIMDSYNAGSQFRIDSQQWVYERGMTGQRVGRLDNDGLWRAENDEVIGRFDDDGVLREHGSGFLDGVLSSQGGTGQELGRLD